MAAEWGAPILAGSGSDAHLLYRVDCAERDCSRAWGKQSVWPALALSRLCPRHEDLNPLEIPVSIGSGRFGRLRLTAEPPQLRVLPSEGPPVPLCLNRVSKIHKTPLLMSAKAFLIRVEIGHRACSFGCERQSTRAGAECQRDRGTGAGGTFMAALLLGMADYP